MPIREKQGLRAFQSDLLMQFPEVSHGVYTRHGGVSREHFRSLNIGLTVGDPLDNVKQNLERMLTYIGGSNKHLQTTRQVHGDHVVVIKDVESNAAHPPDADAIITDLPDVPLLMRFADCVPILLYDPEQGAVGVAHAGWRGTVASIAAEIVAAMQREYSSSPKDIVALIGPSIGPDHYEVGEEVKQQFEDNFSLDHASELFDYPNGPEANPFLDLWQANRIVLENAGVTQIDVAEVSTASHTDLFYSYRAETGPTGRFGAMIMLT